MQRLCDAGDGDVRAIAASQIDLLSRFYDLALSQAGRSFRWALITSVVGMIFLLVAILLMLWSDTAGPAMISLIPGVLIEFIAGVNFYLYGKTLSQLSLFQGRLEITQRFLLANSLCESLGDDWRDKTRARLIDQLTRGDPLIRGQLHADDMFKSVSVTHGAQRTPYTRSHLTRSSDVDDQSGYLGNCDRSPRMRRTKTSCTTDIRHNAALEHNFRQKFEALNRVNLTDAEFARLRDEIITADVFTAAQSLREKGKFNREDGTPLEYMLVNLRDWCKNDFEVINQLRSNTDSSYHRYSVDELIAGKARRLMR